MEASTPADFVADSNENLSFYLNEPVYFPGMTIDQIAPEALRLPAKDRALLAASLWESIADPYAVSSDRSDEEVIALALARNEELESGTATPLSHADLMQRLRR